MKQGEIWLINLDPSIGAEIRKTRPAVIVNDDSLGRLPLRIIVPITEWKEHFSIAPWMVHLPIDSLNKLSKPSSIDCFQVRSLSVDRCIKKLGKVSPQQLEQIKEALAKVLSIEDY
jgi:mRNA interferase MazF